MHTQEIVHVYVDDNTPRMHEPYVLTPDTDITGTTLIGYLKCSTKRMREVFGRGRPFPGQWILTFHPSNSQSYVVNIHRSLQRNAIRDWNITACIERSDPLSEDSIAKRQARVNYKIAAVAGAVFSQSPSDLADYR